MATDNKRQLKIPRHILAMMVGDNPQAIIAMEKLQKNAFDELPDELKLVYEHSMAMVQQAMMIANQALEQTQTQLNPVGVSGNDNAVLDSIGVYVESDNYLNEV